MKNKKNLLTLTSLLMLLTGCQGNNPSAGGSVNPSETPSVPASEITPVTPKPSTSNEKPTPSTPEITYYTITFDLDGGTILNDDYVKPQKIQEGRWAKKPAVDPEKDHCTFLGWYDSADNTPFSFNQGIYGNVALIAKWQVNEEDKITLTFNPNNGEPTFTVDTFIGDFPNVPNPTKDGRVFKGWYVNGEADKRWTGYVDSSLSGKTLIALYEKQSFNYKYEINDDGTATITGLIKIDTANVAIPESINGHVVTKIGPTAFQSRIYVTEISIPKTVTDISPKAFLGTRALQSIKVSSANPSYKSSSDGILFTKDGTTLVYCPQKALVNATSYTCPSNLLKIGDYAFYGQGDVGLSSIILNEGLEEIGTYAFYECYSRNSISFPDSLKKIGDKAFQRFTAGTTQFNINWGNGLEEIGESAFVGCYLKDTLKLPDSLKIIGDYAFTSTEDAPCAITKVILPASLEYFGNAAFFYGYGINTISLSSSNPNFKVENNRLLSKDGTKLYWAPSDTAAKLGVDTLTIPEGVTELRPHSLSEVRFTDTVNLPSTLKIIGDDAFHYNYTITSITIPNSVEVIGEEAFRRMDKLSSVTFGNGISSIGEAAFYEDSKLTEVTIPSNVKTIGKEAFAECTGLTKVTLNEGLTEIGEKAFSSVTKLTSIEFPNSLTTLGNSSFADDTALTTIVFGTGLTNFGASVFGGSKDTMAKPTSRSVKGSNGPKVSGNTLLSADGKTVYYCSPVFNGTITIPAGVTKINDFAYAYVPATGLDLGSSIEEIGEGAFRSAFTYSSKVKAVFPSSLKKIDDGAFYFSNLAGATFNEGLESIGVGAFSSTSLGAVSFPSTLKTIDTQAFFFSGITSVTLNEGLESIGKEAFLANVALSGEITIPSTLTSFGPGAFAGRNNDFTNGITGYKVAAGNNFFAEENGVLYSKDKTTLYAFPSNSANTSLVLPSTVKRIEDYAIAGARNLTTVTLNDGLETLGEHAFSCSTKITSVTLPSSIKSMGYRTFYNWTNAQTVNRPFSEDYANRMFGTDWNNSTKANLVYNG